jgi:hypothetical protein
MIQDPDTNDGAIDDVRNETARYLADSETWIRRGKPGKPPQAPDYDILAGDVLDQYCEMEARIRNETGLSHWRYYDPEYYHPMMQARRDAFAAGQDLDAAAWEFHRNWQRRFGNQHRGKQWH